MLYCSYKNTLMRRTILFDNKADWYWTGCGWKLTKVNYFKTWTSAAVATLTAGTNEHTFFAVLFVEVSQGVVTVCQDGHLWQKTFLQPLRQETRQI